MTVGEKLRQHRGHLTQEEVATQIGITKSAYAMYERDQRKPRDEVKVKLAKFYGVSVEALFFQY